MSLELTNSRGIMLCLLVRLLPCAHTLLTPCSHPNAQAARYVISRLDNP